MAAQQAVYIPYEPPSEERLLAEELTQAAQWMPDDASKRCLVCNGGFDKVFKSKHHCRACGILVCNGCSSQRALIPLGQCVLPPISDITRSENELDARTPQRVCLNCWRDLAPLQEDLQQTVSRSVVPVESDRSNFGRFLNLPFQVTLQDEIRKGANTLHNYMPDNEIEGGDTLPAELLWGCTGLAFLTVVKGGFFFSGTCGTGCVVAKLPDGRGGHRWSAPSAICLLNVGWGFQVGGEVTDIMFVLNSREALETFAGAAHFSLGTELGVSVGPVGRTAGSDIRAGKGGVASAFAYAHSRGLFVGVSIEAGVIITRPDANEAYYGGKFSARQLLDGSVPPPQGAEVLYRALHELEAAHTPSFARVSNQVLSLAQGRAPGGGNWTRRIDYSSGRAAAESSRIAFEQSSSSSGGGGDGSGGGVASLSDLSGGVAGAYSNFLVQPPQLILSAEAVSSDGGGGGGGGEEEVDDQERADFELAAKLQAEEDEAFARARGGRGQRGQERNAPSFLSSLRGAAAASAAAASGASSSSSSASAVAAAAAVESRERLPGEDQWTFERRQRLRMARLRSVAAYDEKGFALPGEPAQGGSADELPEWRASGGRRGGGSNKKNADDGTKQPQTTTASSLVDVSLSLSSSSSSSTESTMTAAAAADVEEEVGAYQIFATGSVNQLPARAPGAATRKKNNGAATRQALLQGLFGDGIATAPVASAAGGARAGKAPLSSAPEESARAAKMRSLFEDDASSNNNDDEDDDDDDDDDDDAEKEKNSESASASETTTNDTSDGKGETKKKKKKNNNNNKKKKTNNSNKQKNKKKNGSGDTGASRAAEAAAAPSATSVRRVKSAAASPLFALDPSLEAAAAPAVVVEALAVADKAAAAAAAAAAAGKGVGEKEDQERADFELAAKLQAEETAVATTTTATTPTLTTPTAMTKPSPALLTAVAVPVEGPSPPDGVVVDAQVVGETGDDGDDDEENPFHNDDDGGNNQDDGTEDPFSDDESPYAAPRPRRVATQFGRNPAPLTTNPRDEDNNSPDTPGHDDTSTRVII